VKALALVALVLAAAGVFLVLRDDGTAAGSGVVAYVIDGDTIALTNGRHVRLVQIDTPEKDSECYGQAATEVTRGLLPPGTHIRIELDPNLDHVDRYHRQLAYVWKGDQEINLTLVRQGAAGVWFFHGTRGRYASELLQAAERARAQQRGLWGACPLARFDPADSMSSGPP
jgi:micrococcal nuclease